jgi:hypothetical protein
MPGPPIALAAHLDKFDHYNGSAPLERSPQGLDRK